MGVPISSMEDFVEKLDARKEHADLFAFFLFDDRPSHGTVERFAEEEFAWLDGLAAAARIFFFVFLRRDRYEEGVANPGLEVARMFGVRPNNLPGVVLFVLSDDLEVVRDGVYLPLKAQLFRDNIDAVEEVFSDLFTLIQESRKRADDSIELLGLLRREVSRLHRRQQARPLLNYLGETAGIVLDFPRRFMDSLQSALAGELARRLSGGP